jgi:hypothetical protein
MQRVWKVDKDKINGNCSSFEQNFEGPIEAWPMKNDPMCTDPLEDGAS